MANKHGDFIWYELLAKDAEAAQAFYGSILNWTYADSGQESVDYRIINAGENSVGGLMEITADMAANGARPTWLGYILVDDVDKCVESIGHAGGKAMMPAMDVPNVGRIAMVTDPQGAVLYVMKPAMEGESLAFAFDHPRVGHCAWNQLATSDQKEAWHFYGTRFGWLKEGEMDMGGMGAYEFIRHGGMIGAMMPVQGSMPPHWMQFFRVPDIDVAKAAVETGGGAVLHGPDQIPGGDYSMVCTDPQGALFGLVGGRA